jgi:hypothetical protein
MREARVNQSSQLALFADELLAHASAARSELQFAKVHVLGRQGIADPGRHFANFENMTANRMLSLYDDCVLLLANERIPAACVLARCILETYAIGEFALFKVARHLKNEGIEKAGKTVLAYVNSSRIKVEEQKRLKQARFKVADYHFTQQALKRMANEEASAKHILDALRHLYQMEISATGRAESPLELLYEQLSEWTHPSQTSLFHAFAEEAWLVETSLGLVSLWDGARAGCARALHLIAGVPDLTARMNALATDLTAAFDVQR